jgi:hypothetical protein
MTDEINFKSDGEILSAENLMENFDFLTNQIFVTAETAGRTTDDTEKYFTSPLVDMVDYGTSTCFVKGDIAFIDAIYDAFDDGSLDADIWSTTIVGSGSISESSSGASGILTLNNPSSGVNEATVIADDTVNDAIDFKDATDREVIVNFSSNEGGGGNAKIFISDGSNHVEIFSGTQTRTTLRILFNNTLDEAYVYLGLDDTSSTTHDISTPTNWYLRFQAQGTEGNGSSMILYAIGYADGSGTTTDYFSVVQTITSASTAVPKSGREELASPSVTYKVSLNNGSNYTTGNLSVLQYTAGTQLIVNNEAATPNPLVVNSSTRNIQSIKNLFQITYS